MGQALNTSAFMQLFFLRIKREEYKQEFCRQMAFSNLSTRHRQLVNKKWSREQAQTAKGFPDLGVAQQKGKMLFHNTVLMGCV